MTVILPLFVSGEITNQQKAMVVLSSTVQKYKDLQGI